MFDQVPLYTLFSVPQRNGLTKPKHLRGEGVKMLNMGELFAERRIQELPMDRVPCSERELETNRLEKGDLLFARQSLTLEGAGQSSIFLGDQEDVVFESHLIRCRLDKSRVDPLYYFYFFESKFGKQRIGNIVEQVAAAGIRGSDLIKLPVFLPSLSNQKAIAHILGTLDDKIELNQKMNQTLEDIAKAIFKSWFVDFDPVRAKAEGRPAGRPPEISDLFPDELVDSEIGEIPKGWELIEVGDISIKETLKVKNFEGSVKVLSALRSGELQLSEEYFTKQVFSKNLENYYVVPKLSFAYNPSRINIGSIGLNTFDFTGAVSPVYSVFTTKHGIHWFFREWLDLDSTKGLIASLCSGSVRQSLKHSDMESIPIVIPPPSLVDEFNQIYDLFVESMETRSLENDTLAQLRDTLLPKLISGELRIPDAEKFLEEAGV